MRALGVGSFAPSNISGSSAPVPPLPDWAFSESFDSFLLNRPVDTEYLIGSPQGFVGLAESSPYTGQKWYTMRDSGTRFLRFKKNITAPALVSLSVIWNGSSGTWDSSGLSLEATDSGEDLVLQYSINGGISWFQFSVLVSGGQRPGGVQQTNVAENVAFSQPFELRIAQINNSGSSFDHYAVKNIVVTPA